MVEVRDHDCINQLEITLCERATQTDVPKTASVGVDAIPNTPPALQEGESQTPVITYTETATQMTPPIKETFVELAPQIVPEIISESFTTITSLNAYTKYIKQQKFAEMSIEVAEERSEDNNIKNETSLVPLEEDDVCEVEKVEEVKQEAISLISDEKEEPKESQIKLQQQE